jgi:hypothetical protein
MPDYVGTARSMDFTSVQCFAIIKESAAGYNQESVATNFAK